MTITEKYNIKMKYNQAGEPVKKHFQDDSENVLINQFEKICLELQSQNRTDYSMIELGSNQAYYSCLFKAILGNSNAKNILLEPTPLYMTRGKEHFQLNNFDGIFDNGCIGHYWCHGRKHDDKLNSYTIDELMSKYNIHELDVLHSDIDGNEIRLLETSTEAFKSKKINYIFLLTHDTWNENNSGYKSKIINDGQSRHNVCKKYLLDLGYHLYFEEANKVVGHDSLLIFNR